MSRAKPRYCECGCGSRLDGRANKRYLNATHRKAGERRRTQLESVTSVTGPYRDTDPLSNVTVPELKKSRIKGTRGQVDTVVATIEFCRTIGFLSDADREHLGWVLGWLKEAASS